jgi:hypothetical protein
MDEITNVIKMTFANDSLQKAALAMLTTINAKTQIGIKSAVSADL